MGNTRVAFSGTEEEIRNQMNAWLGTINPVASTDRINEIAADITRIETELSSGKSVTADGDIMIDYKGQKVKLLQVPDVSSDNQFTINGKVIPLFIPEYITSSNPRRLHQTYDLNLDKPALVFDVVGGNADLEVTVYATPQDLGTGEWMRKW